MPVLGFQIRTARSAKTVCRASDRDGGKNVHPRRAGGLVRGQRQIPRVQAV